MVGVGDRPAVRARGFGENLTTEGFEVNDALVGERWVIRMAVLEVSEPRVPCCGSASR